MPNPIPRNRSAGGRQPRRPVRHRVWSILPFQRPQENIRQPAPPPPQPTPPQPRPPARHRATPGTPFQRPQENIRQPGQTPPQPRRPARHRDTPGLPLQRRHENVERPAQPPRQPRPPARPGDWLFRRPQGNAGRPGPPPPPHATQSGAKVAVGTLFLAVASFVVWLAVPLFSSETPLGAVATPPVSGHTDIAPMPGNDPGAVGGQLAAPPEALTGVDPGPAPETPTVVGLTSARRDSGPSVTGSQPNSAPPSQPSEPANVADLGQRVDPPPTDQGQQHPPRPHKPSPEETPPPPKAPPAPPPVNTPPPVKPGPTPEEQRKLAQQVAQFARDWKANAGTGKPTPPPAGKDSGPKAVGKQESGVQSRTGGQKNAKVPSSNRTASTRSGSSKASSGSSGSSSGSSGPSSSGPSSPK